MKSEDNGKIVNTEPSLYRDRRDYYANNRAKFKDYYANNKARFREYNRKSYLKSAEDIKRAGKEERVKKKAELVLYKGGFCTDCGRKFPDCCFQFDHRDPATKSFNICDKWSYPIERLKTEADKCDLVCACCHAIRTYDNELITLKMSAGHDRRRHAKSLA
jgi:hypothetical protein